MWSSEEDDDGNEVKLKIKCPKKVGFQFDENRA